MGSLEDRAVGDLMTDVDQARGRIDGENNPLHRGHIGVTQAEITCQGYDARGFHGQFSTSLGTHSPAFPWMA